MLTPEQLKSIPDRLVLLFIELEDFILSDIARRMAKAGKVTGTAKIQLEIAKAIKTPLKEIEQAIKNATELALVELDSIFKSESVKALDLDDAIYKRAGMDASELYKSGILKQILDEGLTQTKGLFYNFTQSTGFAIAVNGKVKFKPIAVFYQDCLDEALLKVRTGVASYQTVTRDAVRRMAKSGLCYVDYKSGYINRVDVAVRRAVVTGVNQMNMRMTEAIMSELKAEYVEVSAHSGARPDHATWQGKVYHVGGFKDSYPDFESATGYGTGAGLGGWNCRHSFAPFFPDISTRTYTDEELKNIDPPDFEYMGTTYTHYEATQVQRGMETKMREIKRELIGYEEAGLKGDFKDASARLQFTKQEYKRFSNAANLKFHLDRAGVEGYGRSIAQKARWAV